jgi:hypothetical protein
MADRDCPAPLVCRTSSLTCEASQAPPEDAPDAPEPPSDAPAVGCWDAWITGPLAIAPPVRIEALRAQSAGTSNPSIAFDGLTIYVTRSGEIMRSTRASLAASFGTPEILTDLQTAADESRISTTADELLAVFASSRTGTAGMLDLWQATRTSKAEPFGNVTAAPLAAFNNANQQFDPEITPDGLNLYWAPSLDGVQTIHHGSRASIQAAFGNETTLPISIPGMTHYYDPGVAPDQRVLVFAAEPAQGDSGGDLYYVRRTSPTLPFSSAIEIPNVNTADHEGDAEISSDGCTIYFASNRAGVNEIYSADVVR